MQSARGVYFSTVGGWDASCPSCLAQPAQSHHNLVNTRHASIHQKAADWRELWPRDASIWKTRQHPFYSPTRVCLASHAFPSLSLTHTQSPLCELTDRKCRPSDITGFISNVWQETGSSLMAGCWQERHALFTIQRGGHPLSYGCDMNNFEVYLDWFKTLKILTKETLFFIQTYIKERVVIILQTSEATK